MNGILEKHINNIDNNNNDNNKIMLIIAIVGKLLLLGSVLTNSSVLLSVNFCHDSAGNGARLSIHPECDNE